MDVPEKIIGKKIGQVPGVVDHVGDLDQGVGDNVPTTRDEWHRTIRLLATLSNVRHETIERDFSVLVFAVGVGCNAELIVNRGYRGDEFTISLIGRVDRLRQVPSQGGYYTAAELGLST